MAKFGETYDRILNELAPAALAPVLPAVKTAGSAAIARGLAALGGGLATLMSNKTKTSTKTKQKIAKPDMVATSTKELPGVEGPIIQSKFDESYERIITELQATAPLPSLAGTAASPGLSPTVTSTSTYTSPGPVRPTGSYSYNTPGSSPTAQAARSSIPRLAGAALASPVGPILAAGAGLGAAGVYAAQKNPTAMPPAPIGAGTVGASQFAQAFRNVVPDPQASTINPSNYNTGQGRYNARGTTAPSLAPTTPTSTPTQADIQTGTLIPSPGTETDTIDAQSQTATQGQGIGKALGIAAGIGAGLATAPKLMPIPQAQNVRTRTRTGNGFSLDLIPTDTKELPGVKGPVVQDRYYIQ